MAPTESWTNNLYTISKSRYHRETFTLSVPKSCCSSPCRFHSSLFFALNLNCQRIHCKIPKISPGLGFIFFKGLFCGGYFWRGLYSEGLIYEGKFAFQNRLAYSWREICVSKSIGLAYSWKELNSPWGRRSFWNSAMQVLCLYGPRKSKPRVKSELRKQQ